MPRYAGWQILLFDVRFFDTDPAKTGLTNLGNYSVQQFLYSFILCKTLQVTINLNS